MKDKLPFAWIAALGFAALLSVAFGTMRKAEVQGPGVPDSQTQPGEYPFDWCPVSGQTLCDRINPEVYVYEGQTFEFCCPHCRKSFEDDPASYLSKLEPAWPWSQKTLP